MTLKKGGGRDGTERRTEGTEGPPESAKLALQTSGVTGPLRDAAADPAAHDHGAYNYYTCPACLQRIRELEAELAALRKGAVEGSWRARAERAEADFAQLKELPPETCPKCGDVQHSGPCREFNPDDPEDWDELPKAVRERYERAEARVAELMPIIGAHHQARERGELRGEDRG